MGLRITFRTLTTKRYVEVFVYTKTGNFFQYSSFTECSKALGVYRTTIRRALKEAQPYNNYFFSLVSLELNYLQSVGFSITSRSLVNCTALVIWGSQGSLSSTVGLTFSTKIRNIIQIPPYILGVIIGLILSDAWLRLPGSAHKNARLEFEQGLINFPYFWFVFTILSPFCSSKNSPNLTLLPVFVIK